MCVRVFVVGRVCGSPLWIDSGTVAKLLRRQVLSCVGGGGGGGVE